MTADRILTRRRALGGAGLAALTGILAACGESQPDLSALLPSPPAGRAGASGAAPVASSVGERAPSRAGAIPAAGAMRSVGVAFPAFGSINWNVEPIFLAAGFAATDASERRYRFEAVPIPSTFDSRFDYAAGLTGGARADLLFTDHADLDNLVTGKRLLPLDEFLQADSGFDPAAYWPDVLPTGRRAGTQYALPIAVAPIMLAFNFDAAATVGLEPPARTSFDREAFFQAALALRGGSDAADRIGYFYSVEPDANVAGDVSAASPMYQFLQSALGPLRDDRGTFAALQTAEAREVVQFVHDMIVTHRLNRNPVSNGRLAWTNVGNGRVGMWPVWLGGIDFTWIRSWTRADVELYPFPRLGSGGNPAETWLMLGLSADVDEPRVAYDALRTLAHATRGVAHVPATRMTVPELQALVPGYHDAEAETVVRIMDGDMTYLRLSRQERATMVNSLDGAIFIDDVAPARALDAAVVELEALRSG